MPDKLHKPLVAASAGAANVTPPTTAATATAVAHSRAALPFILFPRS
ncbi:hypothetical protein [Gordonia sp. NPDC003422]